MAQMQLILIGLGCGLAGVLAGWLLRGVAPHETMVDRAEVASAPQPLSPTDFAFLPCPAQTGRAACSLLAAGGKRVLIGAPAGIGQGTALGDGTLPDIVLVPDLSASAIEGLDEVRNATWRAGRREKLIIAGGEGIGDVVDGLNAAYTLPDARAFLDNGDGRDFESTLLVARTVSNGDIAFDTGDLVVTVMRGRGNVFGFMVRYLDIEVLVQPCGTDRPVDSDLEAFDHLILCGEAGQLPENARVWPLDHRLDLR